MKNFFLVLMVVTLSGGFIRASEDCRIDQATLNVTPELLKILEKQYVEAKEQASQEIADSKMRLLILARSTYLAQTNLEIEKERIARLQGIELDNEFNSFLKSE
jgi:hypothetical protein